MSHAKCVTKDDKNNPEYCVVAVIRRLQTDKTVPQKNHGQTMLKMSIILDLKRPMAPQILDSLNTMMQRKVNKKAAGLRRMHYLLHHADETQQGQNSCPVEDYNSWLSV